jgi:peptidoglycan/xylan/chitin deacetylase (PgdA/CDA1 family)
MRTDSSNLSYGRDVPHGIMFHHFHGGRHPRIPGSISADDFAAIIRFVGRERILDPLEWIERAERGRLGPEDLCLTFDDALLCQFEIALPVLQRYDLRGFWFVYSNVFEGHISRFEAYRVFRTTCFRSVEEFYELFFKKVFDSGFSQQAQKAWDENEVSRIRESFPFYSAADVRFRIVRDVVLERDEYDAIMQELVAQRGQSVECLAENLWMSNEHLRFLSDCSHAIGLHSYSHPMLLGEQSYAEQCEEYTKNYQHLARVSGPPRSIAYPAGSYNQDTLTILQNLGISCGFRSSMSSRHRAVRLNTSALELAREDHSNIMRQNSNC